MKRDHRGHWDRPDGWHWAVSENRDACPSCATQLAVAKDAVGGFDFAAIGQRALENLSEGLARINYMELSDQHAAHIGRAVDRAVAQLAARDAKKRHARRHPTVTPPK